ncbi:MAG: glycosyltransferase [Candidatus Shapirobacteria bacterium]|jgi:glycosyltransferase involved in cell wall biosynthesis
MKNILFISNNTLTDSGLSGGDRILIELVRNWSQKFPTALLATGECVTLFETYHALKKVKIFLSSPKKAKFKIYSNFNYFLHAVNRTFIGVKAVFKYRSELKKYTHIYSASDFYPDFLPALFLKILNPKITWVAGFYLFAPKPWQKNNPYRTSLGRFFTGFYYWLTQRLSYSLIYHFADIVCVTSDPDIKYFFSPKRNRNKIVVVRGGVDIKPSHLYLKKHQPSLKNKKFNAVFIGRLHYQKGVLELIDIWKKVCLKFPKYQLAMIGNGQLLPDIKKKIKKLKLSKNITLFGFVDGTKKFKIFKESAIAVHPSTYDSGGMATAEAMAWGLPGVSFDLEALLSYYPHGLIKTRCFNIDEFADNIIKLNTDEKLYSKYSKQAIDLIENHWSWDSRANDVINQIIKYS